MAVSDDRDDEPKAKKGKSKNNRDNADGDRSERGKSDRDKPDRERAFKAKSGRDQSDRDDRDEDEEKSESRGEPARGKSDRDKPEKGKSAKRKADRDDRADDEEEGEKRPRELKVGDRKVPYPPSPADVPDGFTDYPDSYTRQQNLLLAGLFVFLVFYIGAVLFFALIGTWCVWSLGHWFLFKVAGIVVCGTFFLFLVKGFFKSHAMNKDMHIEITEEEHPLLFAFIEHLCDELDAPLPNKVYVAPDVNAAVMPRTSLLNLFVEPKKDLLIGLGLVNSVNLSEFKAVLAHEFGHFSQSAMASSYTYVAHRIIADLVEGEDWFDRMVNWCKKQQNAISVFGYAIGAPLWVGRKVLEWFYKAITLQRLAVSREREFHADLVAVSAAGSNAVVHCLLRTEFGHQCFVQAINDMATALDHKLYSNDMYLHQDRASAIVRRKKKEPKLGLPPLLKTPNDGKDIEVFDAEEEEMEDEIPPMWRTHPSNSDREKNAKEEFVSAVVDHRSPWILFDDPAELKERMTYKFYRMVFRIPKNADLCEAIKVQKFIDNEHADTTYDPKYKGAYDDRPLEPGDLSELDGIIRDNPWDDERMEKVLTKLYDGCEEHAEAHSELYKEMQSLRSGIVGRPSSKMKKKMDEIEKKQDENWEWFKSFDRRVYLLHVQMAVQLDKDTSSELVERYRFQLEVQRLYQESRAAFNKADAYLSAYAAAARGEIQVPPDFPGEVIQVLRESWKALKNIIKTAREINLPAMKNFEEGDNLADFILEGKMVPEPPLSYVKGVWIDKLMTQLQGVRQRCFRLHFKSVGGILRLQEEIATKWKTLREPVAAEVVEPEPIPAEVVEPEPIPAEVVESNPNPAEVASPEPKSLDVIKSVINSTGGVDAVLAKAMGRNADTTQSPEAAAKTPAKASQPEEPIAAEIIPAEIIPAEVIPAEVVAEQLPPEPPLPVGPTAPEPSKTMAAFVPTPITVPTLPEWLSPSLPSSASSPPAKEEPVAAFSPPPTREEPAPEPPSPPVSALPEWLSPLLSSSASSPPPKQEEPAPKPPPVPGKESSTGSSWGVGMMPPLPLPVATEKSLGEEQRTKAESATVAETASAPSTTTEKATPVDASEVVDVVDVVDAVEVEQAPVASNEPKSVTESKSHKAVAPEEIFSLDTADVVEEAPPASAPKFEAHAKAASQPAEIGFSLDADDHKPGPAQKTEPKPPRSEERRV